MANVGSWQPDRLDTIHYIHKLAESRVGEGYSVISGCDVHENGTPDMDVVVDSGEIFYGDVYKTVAGNNVTISAADGTNDRIDVIYVDSSGVAQVHTGDALPVSDPLGNTVWTQYESPYPKTGCPAGVIIALVYVPANDTSIENAQIEDIAQYNLGALIDDFAPATHASQHKSGGADAIKLDELAPPTDVSTLNASTSAHGLLKKLDNDPTHFMNGQGAWATPDGATLPYKTVGPYEWCDYVTDGSADQTEINTALATGYPVCMVGSLVISGTINIPTSGNPELFGMKSTITVASNSADPVIADNSGKISNAKIHDFSIDAASYNVSGIKFGSGAENCRIYNVNITGIVQSSSDDKSAIWLAGDLRNCSVNNNYIYLCTICSAIWANGHQGYGNSGITIYGNRVYRCNPYGTQPTPAIWADNASIVANVIDSFGTKTQDFGTLAGDGIGGRYNTITGNIIIGAAKSGIIPGLQCTVTGNIIIAPGSNGIDYWYSSYSVISGNQILYPGNMDMGGDWDQSGIDVADHSAHTLITSNYVNGQASHVTDTLAATATSGNNYIQVSDFTKWYSGMRIKIGANDKYRIDYIDYANSRVYLTTNLSTNYSSSTTVTGVNCMTVGICVGDNGQSFGTHVIMANYIIGPTTDRYMPSGSSMLENTYIDDYLYTSALTFYYGWNRNYTLYTDGKYYNATYIYGVGTKKVEIT